MKLFIGFVIAFLIGVFCQLLHIALPAPPTLMGAALVTVISCGYVSVDLLIRKYKKPKY